MVEPTSSTAEGAPTIAAGSDDATRGRPYYEKLRNDLKETIEKKQELDRTMAAIETSISKLESNYLEDTSAAGNIIKGFDNYIKSSMTSTGVSATSGTGTATRRKAGISDQDRIFSRSSVSWIMRDSPTSLTIINPNTSATPSNTATPTAALSAPHLQSGPGSARDTPGITGGAMPKAGGKNKKKVVEKEKEKEKDDADGEGERPSKRGKVSW